MAIPAAWELPILKLPSFTAAADLRTNQFQFVKLNASGQVVLCGTLGEGCIGVLNNKPNLSEQCEIISIGVTKLKVSAAIVPGAAITTTAAGLGVTAATGQTIAGRALNSGSGNGSLIACFIFMGGLSA